MKATCKDSGQPPKANANSSILQRLHTGGWTRRGDGLFSEVGAIDIDSHRFPPEARSGCKLSEQL